MTVPAWHAAANCRSVDPMLFYPTDFAYQGPRGVALAAAQAKAVCRECPVAEQCFRWAIEIDDRYAVLGGFTASERYEMKRRRGAA